MRTTPELLQRLAKDPSALETLLKGLLEPDFKPVPDFPSVEVSKDGKRVRVVTELSPQKDGYFMVQVGGKRLRARLHALHRAAHPDLWPASVHVEGTVIVRDRDEQTVKALVKRCRKADAADLAAEERELRLERQRAEKPVEPDEPKGASAEITDEQIQATLRHVRRT